MPEIVRMCETQTTKCLNCGELAEVKMLYLTPLNEPAQLISVIKCDICGSCSTNMDLITKTHENGGIKIDCKFDSREDLGLYVSMTKMAILRIFNDNGEIFYEYQSNNNIHCVVENILQKIIEELVDCYGLNYKYELMGGYQSLSETEELIEKEKKKIQFENVSDSTKIHVYEIILQVRRLMDNPKFKMEIRDDSGYSRIVPDGKRLVDMVIDDLESFNSEKIKHKWINEENIRINEEEKRVN